MTFIGYDVNEYGTKVSVHICDTCEDKFMVCPDVGNRPGWRNCLKPECPSYDPGRDADKLFGDDGEILPGSRIGSTPILRGPTHAALS